MVPRSDKEDWAVSPRFVQCWWLLLVAGCAPGISVREALSPGGAAFDSQGRQPLDLRIRDMIEAPEGRQIEPVAPPGLNHSLRHFFQGLTPLAIKMPPLRG